MSPSTPARARRRARPPSHPSPPSPPSIDRQARDWLRQRNEAAFRGFLILAVPSILFAVAPLFCVLVAFFHRFFGARLARNGLLVPATLLRTGSTDAGTEWKQETDAMIEQIPEEGADVVSFASDIAAFAGRLVPAVLVHYEFRVGGKSYRVAKYMFTDEAFYRDEDGRPWALVDRRHPRFQHWLVCRPPGS